MDGYDLVYINTSVILDYMVAARWHSRAVIHVREIPTSPALLIVRFLLKFSRASIVYNSHATRSALGLRRQHQYVAYNGVGRPENPKTPSFRQDASLKILLIGRINDWKGQDLLVAALSLLGPEIRNRVRVRIVGGTYENNVGLEAALQDQIATNGLGEVVSVDPFADNPSEAYRWADIVVIPSKKPEPFGRIAIEGMAHMRPILAAAHGGLLEIVEHKKTGWLIPANDAGALANTITSIVAGEYDLEMMGRAGYERYLDMFTVEKSDQQLSKIWLAVGTRDGSAKSRQAMRLPSIDRLKKVRILCVHQGSELYGSDRSFLDSIDGLRLVFPNAEIVAVLPAGGALAEHLVGKVQSIIIEPLFVIRRRHFWRTLFHAIVAFPPACFRASSLMAEYDLVYINTSVVLDYILTARWHTRAVVHVHEIPNPSVLRAIRALLRFSHAAIIYNSYATRSRFDLKTRQWESVVYNGVGGPQAPEGPNFRPGDVLKVLMIGRINDWKGQDLLVQALSLITADVRGRLRVRIVGGTYENNIRIEGALRQQIAVNKLEEFVSIEPFVDDPNDSYEWADIVVVPSKKPEPFGRIAIEGMAHMRPILAAAHGGLLEIVDHGTTGWLFPANDAGALAAAITGIVIGKYDLKAMGKSARERYLAKFTYERTTATLCAQLSDLYGLQES